MTDLLLIADISRKYVKDSHKTYCLNPLYFLSISDYTFTCALHKTKQQIDFSKVQDLKLTAGKNRGCVSGVFGPR